MNNYANMLHYLNTHPPDDSYSRIILFLTNNRKQAKSISIQEIAEACFVSNATISRFSRFFGFDNFVSLKHYIHSNNEFSPNFTFRITNDSLKLLEVKPDIFLQNYKNSIITSLNDVIDCLNMDEIDSLLKDIYNSDNIYLFGSESLFNLTQELQRGFFISDKISVTGQTIEDMERVSKVIDKNSLVIILSSFGNFLTEHNDIVNRIIKSKSNSFFITQHTENMASTSFNKVLSVTSRNHVEAGSYPLAFFCEFIVRRYFTIYGNQ